MRAMAALLCLYIVGACAPISTLPPLHNGDIVFQNRYSLQSEAIEAASESTYTHVGIIKIDPKTAQIIVIEAVGPVKETPLKEFITHGKHGVFSIWRVKNLTPQEESAVIKAAQTFSGRPYDIFFTFDRKTLYCSELVYYAFYDGVGIILGRKQKLGDLKIDKAAVQTLLYARWSSHPKCKGIKTYEACLPRMLVQDLITPVSIVKDPRLVMVYSNYP